MASELEQAMLDLLDVQQEWESDAGPGAVAESSADDEAVLTDGQWLALVAICMNDAPGVDFGIEYVTLHGDDLLALRAAGAPSWEAAVGAVRASRG